MPLKYETINITMDVINEFLGLEFHLHDVLKKRTVKSAPVPHLNGSRCWIFTGGQSQAGYGQITSSFKLYPGFRFYGSAHRIAWMIWKGDTMGLNVQHKCDHPVCINPDHLYVGTPKQNIKDAVQRRNYSDPLNRTWKLTINSVKFIRRLLESKDYTQVEIGKAFGISQANVSKIKNREIYFHI